ncbi:hypothetical protein MSG28_005869 [Choristoneura fumiferana]|uniref:Uncharacterized protein n=1 Tax=Choristoneura fumiferana TaxID=7141 RepID=A0ACC0L0N4_CHOFU|nr:hypothetical protein MSG28_005869 [Choristoneura fumiferana]
MERWVGKTAVVTGASAGIGAVISVQLADAGLRVVGLARRPDLVDNLNAEVTGKGKIYGKRCDIAKTEEIAEAFSWVEEQLGGVDLLVNNAGLLVQGHITEMCSNPVSDESVQRMIDINVKGVVLCSRRAVASMKRRDVHGHIVNINSMVGHFVPSVPIFAVYTSSKHAVTAFTTALADELGHTKARIKTTSISPGLVDTAMAVGLLDGIMTAPPMLKAADVASAVLYAVSTPPDVNVS